MQLSVTDVDGVDNTDAETKEFGSMFEKYEAPLLRWVATHAQTAMGANRYALVSPHAATL